MSDSRHYFHYVVDELVRQIRVARYWDLLDPEDAEPPEVSWRKYQGMLESLLSGKSTVINLKHIMNLQSLPVVSRGVIRSFWSRLQVELEAMHRLL